MKKLLLAALFAITSPAAADGSGGRYLQLVSPNQSIQSAIDRAAEGGWIFVLPGTYRETADATNGLKMTRGVHLVGLSTPKKKVCSRTRAARTASRVPASHRLHSASEHGAALELLPSWCHPDVRSRRSTARDQRQHDHELCQQRLVTRTSTASSSSLHSWEPTRYLSDRLETGDRAQQRDCAHSASGRDSTLSPSPTTSSRATERFEVSTRGDPLATRGTATRSDVRFCLPTSRERFHSAHHRRTTRPRQPTQTARPGRSSRSSVRVGILYLASTIR